MVLEETVTPTFSIERLESVMLSQNVTWKMINDELECDAESLLKSKKPPMQNVINKVCSVIGMKNSDYVMMKSSTIQIQIAKDEQSDEKLTVSSSFIDSDMVDLYIKESEWNYTSICTLMSSKSVFKFNGYLKRVSAINKEDLDTLCWALIIKKNDICNVNLEDGAIVPARKIFSRHTYIINKDLINELSRDMEHICKVSHIPTWFVFQANDIYVSIEMAEMLLEAINKVTDKQITLYELCTNYDGTTVNKREYNTKKKEVTTVSPENSIIDTCNMLADIIYKSNIDVHDVGYDISNIRCILQAEDHYYIRRDDLNYFVSNYLNLGISTVTLIHRLIKSGVCNSFKEGVRDVPTRKLNGYGGIRFIEINKDKFFSTANNHESQMLYMCNASEKERIRAKKEQEEIKNEGDDERPRFYKTHITNHGNRYRSNNTVNNNGNKCLDVFSIVDHLSNSELDKVIEYIDTIKKLRELRNSVK